jgi:hypothetical protein
MAFSGSKVISQTVSTVTGRLGTLVGVWAAFFAIQIVLFLVMGGMMGGAMFGSLMTGGAMMEGGNPAALAGLSVGIMVGLFVVYLAYLVIGAASTAAMTAAASPLIRPSAGESIGIGFRSVPTMVGVILLFILVYLLGAIAFGIAAAILGAISEGLALVAIVVAVPVLIWAACRVSIVFPVIAVDRVTGPVAAIRRAWNLTRGHVLQITDPVLGHLCPVRRFDGFDGGHGRDAVDGHDRRRGLAVPDRRDPAGHRRCRADVGDPRRACRWRGNPGRNLRLTPNPSSPSTGGRAARSVLRTLRRCG